ncbi:MAG: DUF6134 family protein [Cytophagales bacterium]|nr:DUF6134 family protein [Cytophagales bacterium]
MRFLSLIVFAFCLQTATCQSLHYDAVRKEKVIGGMDIVIKKHNDERIYDVRSNMEFRVLVSLKVIFENTETFKNGILQTGSVANKMIGFKENEAHIEKTPDKYHLWINGTPEPIDDQEITYTVSQIYTQEPKDGQKVFSQYYGTYFTFEKTGEHEYKYTSSEGDNHYTYLNGICTDVKVERDFATIYFKLKPESLAAVKKNASQFQNND